MSDPNTSNAAASSASSTAATPATSTEPTAQDVAHNEPVPVMTADETALASGADVDTVLGAGADPGDAPAHSAEVPLTSAPVPSDEELIAAPTIVVPTKEEVVKAGYTPEAADSIVAQQKKLAEAQAAARAKANVTSEPAAEAPEPGVYLQVQHEGDEDVVTLELRTDSSQSLKELVADALAAHHPNPGSFLGRAITTLEGVVLTEGLTLLENQIEKGHTIKIVGLPK